MCPNIADVIHCFYFGINTVLEVLLRYKASIYNDINLQITTNKDDLAERYNIDYQIANGPCERCHYL